MPDNHHCCRHEREKRADDADAILGMPEQRRELEKRPEQKSLDDESGGSAEKRRDEDRGHGQPVFTDPRPKLPPRPSRLFVTRRLDRPRERRRGNSLARRLPVEPQNHRTADDDLRVRIRIVRPIHIVRPIRLTRRRFRGPITLGDGVRIL